MLSILQVRILSPLCFYNLLTLHLTGPWQRWAWNHSQVFFDSDTHVLSTDQWLSDDYLMIIKIASGVMRHRTNCYVLLSSGLSLRESF